MEDDKEDNFDEAVCNYCKMQILPDKCLGPESLCEGSYCEEAKDGFVESRR